jgi:serine/threonine-protein kinase
MAHSSLASTRTELRDRLQASLEGEYRLERELGGGGMSRVFVAQEGALDRPVVVKVLPPELTGSLSIERFRREIQLAARVHHPHIVPVLLVGQADGLLYYTMPYIVGESLRERIDRQGPLPIADVIRILRDVADALGHAHGLGVLHRDVKPDNILLVRHHALMTDFGVAKALRESRPSGDRRRYERTPSTGFALGTPAYMAPEQAAADPTIDARADIYALGCVAYEMLTGKPPFSGRSAQKIIAAQVAERPVPLSFVRPDVGPRIETIVMRCLEKNPDHRWQEADDLVDALDELAAQQSALAIGATQRAEPQRLTMGQLIILHVAGAIILASSARVARDLFDLPSWTAVAIWVVVAVTYALFRLLKR